MELEECKRTILQDPRKSRRAGKKKEGEPAPPDGRSDQQAIIVK